MRDWCPNGGWVPAVTTVPAPRAWPGCGSSLRTCGPRPSTWPGGWPRPTAGSATTTGLRRLADSCAAPPPGSKGAPMDVRALRQAHEDFLEVAKAGGFGPPPPGEWDAERLLAHVAAADTAIASAALAVAAGQRPAYDNRPSLDEWNLRRIVAEAGGLDGLVELVRERGRLLCEVAAALSESAGTVRINVLIISNDELIVDEPWPLADLIAGVGTIHLPRHARQLAGLRS